MNRRDNWVKEVDILLLLLVLLEIQGYELDNSSIWKRFGEGHGSSRCYIQVSDFDPLQLVLTGSPTCPEKDRSHPGSCSYVCLRVFGIQIYKFSILSSII